MVSSTKRNVSDKQGGAMVRHWLSLIASVGLTVSSCDASPTRSGPEIVFPYVTARFDCTQEDIPAVGIRLSTTSAGDALPVVLVEVAGLGDALRLPLKIALSGLRRDPEKREARFARASLEETPQELVWLTGTLEIHSLTLGKEMDGAYDFRVPDGRAIRGAFHAPWGAGTSSCG